MDNDLPNGRRLNGWKEIAAYFGKGVRTVQRWEKTFGLPVHRIGIGGGEIVYAFIAELERWRLTAEAAAAGERKQVASAPRPSASAAPSEVTEKPQPVEPQSPTRWPRAAVAVALCLPAAIVVILILVPRFSPGGPASGPAQRIGLTSPNPDHVRVADGKLRVFDVRDHPLWEAPFDTPLTAAGLEVDRSSSSRLTTAVEDINGDGRNEVLVAHRNLYCFNADGSRRFVAGVGREVQFGDTRYKPPFPVNGFFITGDPGRAKTIWAIGIHSVWFPSVLSRFNVSGQLLSEYWSDGHITSLVTATMRGRKVVVVGACNNERKGGSLAVFDEQNVVGSAPAAKSKYSCPSCGSAPLLAFFVFPPTRLASELDIPTPVLDLKVSGGVLTVVTNQSGGVVIPPDPQRLPAAYVYYDFDSDLRIVHADVNDGYGEVQRRLEQIGRVTARSRFVSERALFPVLSWANNQFVAITGPKTGR